MNSVRTKGWHPDPFGLHFERFYYDDDQPGRLVRDERRRESFDDLPEDGSPKAAVRTVDPHRMRVLPNVRDEPPTALLAEAPPEPWLIASPDAAEPGPASLDHSHLWIDPPSDGWIHRFHELSVPWRRLRYVAAVAALAVVALILGLTLPSSGPNHPGSASLPSRSPATSPPPVTGPAGLLPPAATTGTPTTLPKLGWLVTTTFPTSSLALNAISCPTSTICEAVGETTLKTGLVLNTTNGGTTWTQQRVPTGIEALSGIACTSTRSCIAVGGITVISTDDGGTTWTVQLLKSQSLNAIACASASVCVAAGQYPTTGTGCNEGATYSTSNGGATWSITTLPCFDALGIACPTVTNCVLVGTKYTPQYQYGEIFGSTDAGAQWKEQFTLTGPNTQLDDVACPAASMCQAVGRSSSQAVMGTTDGGTTWTNQLFPQNGDFKSFSTVACQSTEVCQVAGSTRPLLTTNGGVTWTTQNLPSVVTQVSGVSCPASGSCLAVGDEGTSGGVVMSATS